MLILCLIQIIFILLFKRRWLYNLSQIILSLILFYDIIISRSSYIVSYPLIMNLGYRSYNWELNYNEVSFYLMILINIIYWFIVNFSEYYIPETLNKFILYLELFKLYMLLLVLSNNWITLFIGWELVGLMSYLLINFWYNNINNVKSALNAIYYNKVGDIAIMILIFTAINNIEVSWPIYLAVIAKSAQFGLQGWLANAMAGPTPVSSILHSATMVCAGIYLLYRLDVLYQYSFIPLFTIILAGLTAINQYDIKKIIAYSTCSQLGYLFFGSINHMDSYFHLFIHGFFKSLLFIVSGYLIHSIYNIQDIRSYGGIIFSYPLLYIYFIIGSISLMAIPFTSGFYSKDILLEMSYYSYSYYIVLFGSYLTILYTYKSLYYTFLNRPYNIVIGTTTNKKLSVLAISSLLLGYTLKDIYSISTIDLEMLSPLIKGLPLLGFLLIIKNKYKVYHLFSRTFFMESIYNRIFYETYLRLLYMYISIEKSLFEIKI